MNTRVRKTAAQGMPEINRELLYSLRASRPRKILFDHLPKCGGSSLGIYLGAHYLKRKTFSINGLDPAGSIDDFKNLSRRKRHGYDLIKGHLAYELFDYVHPDCLKVTVFREPVERIISHYYYAKRTPAHYLYSKIHNSEMSLEDYATSGLSGELRNWYTTYFSGLTADDADQAPEEAIEKAVDVVLSRYDIIGFLDDFSSFAEILRAQADLRYEYPNEKVNESHDRPSTNDVEQSVILKIQEVNYLDMAFYKKIRDTVS